MSLPGTPGQIRTVDLRLRKGVVNSTISGSYGDLRQNYDNLIELSAKILRSVADRKSVKLEQVRALAEGVLADRTVVLARAVLEAEPEFVLARAVELAALLLCDGVGVEDDCFAYYNHE